jgi:hypothetical protein
MIKPDSKLGELFILSVLVSDQPDNESCGRVREVYHPRQYARRVVLILCVLGHSAHTEYLFVPGGASIGIAHGQLNV